MRVFAHHPFRRTAVVSAAAVLATVSTMAFGPFARAGEGDFVLGSGKAKATIVRVGPSAARLSLAPTVGVALSDHLGTLGRGQDFIFDYAALDGSIDNDGPDLKRQFPPLRVASTDDGAASGVTWKPKPGIVENAAATASPVGRSAISLNSFDLPGVIEIHGSRARSFSGVYTMKGKPVRVAGGTVDIDLVNLGGGAVVMRHLRWEAAQVTDTNNDTKPEMIGKGFVVGSITAQGETHDGPIGAKELGAIVDPLNDNLLSHLGLKMDLPRVSTTGSLVTLTPLSIRLAGNALAPLNPYIQQVRDPVASNIIAACFKADGTDSGSTSSTSGGGGGLLPGLGRVDSGEVHGQAAGDAPKHEEFNEFKGDGPGGSEQTAVYEPPKGSGSSSCGVPFLALDLAMAGVTGGGSMSLDLGGVTGITEGDDFSGDYCLFCGGFGNLNENTTSFVGDTTDTTIAPVVEGASVTNTDYSGGASSSGDTGGVVDSSGGATNTGGATDYAATGPLKLAGSRSSAAWAVGLVGLITALAMGLTDFRRLQSRRRAITPIT